MISLAFRKTMIAGLIAVLALAALPASGVLAAGEFDPPTPSASGQIPKARLEQAWARELKLYDRIGKGFDKTDTVLAKIQGLLDKASAKGKNVSAVQSALDAFKAATDSARPVYESARSIVDSHTGFDGNGKVTDATQAKVTVQSMRTKLQEIKAAMNGTGKALREAIRAFRQANKPAATSTPGA